MTLDLVAPFSAILGAEKVRLIGHDEVAWDPHALPCVLLTPTSVEELQELVRAAAKDGVPLVPVGGNTKPRVPGDGAPLAALVSTAGLDRVIAHEAGDLTFTVEAGLTLKAAQESVGRSQQELPLSAPFSDRATLGGIVATAEEGPTLAAYGPVRDQVLGIEVVHGDGRHTKAGGRVVKNVTGYDLMRLYTGARGTLGIITQITFRLKPFPEAARFVLLPFDDAEAAWRHGMKLRAELPELFAVHVLHGSVLEAWDASDVDTALLITIAGAEALVDALVEQCATTGARTLEAERWRHLQTPFPPDVQRLRAATLPTRAHELLTTVVGATSGPLGWVLDVLTGTLEIAYADWGTALQGGPRSVATPSEDADAENALGSRLASVDAWVDVPTDPTFHQRRFEHFPSSRPGGLALMQGLMKTLDPESILNPGRFEVSP